MARRRGCEWAFAIDHDEWVHPLGDLREIPSRCEVDVLRLAIREAVARSEDDPADRFATNLFKRPSSRGRTLLAMLLGCRRAFFRGEYFRGHRSSKAAYRLASGVTLRWTHGPMASFEGISVAATDRILLLHFDATSFAAWRAKWTVRVDVPTRSAWMRPNRRRQRDRFARARARGEGDLRRLHRRLHALPRYERFLLRKLGLLRKIDLDAD